MTAILNFVASHPWPSAAAFFAVLSAVLALVLRHRRPAVPAAPAARPAVLPEPGITPAQNVARAVDQALSDRLAKPDPPPDPDPAGMDSAALARAALEEARRGR